MVRIINNDCGLIYGKNIINFNKFNEKKFIWTRFAWKLIVYNLYVSVIKIR